MLTFFFFNDTATTEIYTLSLHDALPIYARTKQISYPVTETKSYSPQTLHGHCRPMYLPVRLTRHHALTALASHRSPFVLRLLLPHGALPYRPQAEPHKTKAAL